MALVLWPRGFAWIIGYCALIQLALVIAGGLRFFNLPLPNEFIFGCIAALLVEEGRLQGYGIAMALAVVGLVAGSSVFLLFKDDFPQFLATWRVLWFGVPAALLIYALVGLERERGLVLPGWLQRRGAESYSLYLWHLFVFGLMRHYYNYTGGGTVLAILWSLALVGTAMAVAYLSWRFIERPFVRAAHKWNFAQRSVAGP